MRPNRVGTDSDNDTINTDVTDPAYHVGLLGSRVRQILEVGGLTGRFGPQGVTGSAAISVSPHFRIGTQQYWSKRAAYQALGLVPRDVNGLRRRCGRTWSCIAAVGLNHKMGLPSLRRSMPYWHLERPVWNGRQGAMDFVMYRVRYVFN